MGMPYPPPMALGKVKGAMAMIWTNLNSSRNKTRIWMESTFAKNFYHRILSTARLDNCKKRFELAVVKSMIIFHKYTSHKRFRQNPIHKLVHPLLAQNWLRIFTLPVGRNQYQWMILDWRRNTFLKVSTQNGSAVQFVGIRRKPIANLLSRRLLCFVKTAINLSICVKTALNGIIPKIICVNKKTLWYYRVLSW